MTHTVHEPSIILAARGLSVGLGQGTPFVQDLDLEVREGEIVALLGANGSGKTTTLMGLSGAIKPQRGAVEFAGRSAVNPLHVRARNGLAFVTQERSVFMGLSVRDNLRVGGCDTGLALEAFPELKPHLRRRVGLLSGGQQQMLAAARAIARAPKVLLADEISTGLAPMIVDRIMQALVEACRTRNMALVLVEQHVGKALALADTCAVMKRGRLGLVGSTSEMRGRLDDIRALYL